MPKTGGAMLPQAPPAYMYESVSKNPSNYRDVTTGKIQLRPLQRWVDRVKVSENLFATRS